MRAAAEMLRDVAPDLVCDGEMHADSALVEQYRQRVFPHSRLKGEANLLVFPNLDAANITLNAVKAMTDAPARRTDPARHGQAGAYPDAVGHLARRRQHDRARRGRGFAGRAWRARRCCRISVNHRLTARRATSA